MKELPKTIYNYMSIERFERLLYTNEWQLSNPVYSNDPKERAMELYHKLRDEESIPAFSCFTDNPNNPMMWHFYGGAYSGVCLGFNVNMMKNILGESIQFHPIKYLTLQEQAMNSISKGRESTLDKLKYKNKEWESEKEIRTFFNLDDCQNKLCPNYPNDNYKKGRFLFGMLRFVTEIHIGERCVLRHFIQALIEGKKVLQSKEIDVTDSYKLFHPHCIIFQTRSNMDGIITSRRLCPK